MPLAFGFADTEAKVANTVKVLEEAGRRYWAPRRYKTIHRGITAKDYSRAVPVVITTLEQLQEHGADAVVWRRLGRKDEQTLTETLDNPDGDALYRRQYARAEAEDERRRAAEREMQRPVCKRCRQKFTDQRWEETTAHRTAWITGDLSVCGTCHADDVAPPTGNGEGRRRRWAARGGQGGLQSGEWGTPAFFLGSDRPTAGPDRTTNKGAARPRPCARRRGRARSSCPVGEIRSGRQQQDAFHQAEEHVGISHQVLRIP